LPQDSVCGPENGKEKGSGVNIFSAIVGFATYLENKTTPDPFSSPICQGPSRYWCHGLTFGGFIADNGPFSPFGGWSNMTKILNRGYERIANRNARDLDIVVFRSMNNGRLQIDHSAFLTRVRFNGQDLDPQATRLLSKNGPLPQAFCNLQSLIRTYGTDFVVYHEL
jgi:hypothetical protein